MVTITLTLALVFASSIAAAGILDPAPEIGTPLAFELEEEYLSRQSSGTACLAEHNRERSNKGLKPLTSNAQLQQAAANHNDYMIKNNCFDHQCPGEKSVGDRIKAAGYQWSSYAENIAWGQQDCAAVMKTWMNSDGHRKNILSNNVDVGCSRVVCSNCKRSPNWTCNFGIRR